MSSRASSNRWFRIFLMMIVIGGLARSAAAQKCWSALGSTAVVSPGSLSNANMVGINLGVASTAPLPAVVSARYAVTGMQDDTGSVPNGKVLIVRFVDTGSDARVRVILRQMNVANEVGGTDVIVFDSDAYPPSATSQIQGIRTNPCVYGGGFNSVTHNYFVVVEVTKSGSTGNPNLQLVQVCEEAGLYC